MTTTDTTALVRQMHEALSSIHRYGLDTLSGRTDGPDDRDWQRAAVNEMTKRARIALSAADQWLAQQRGPLTDEEIIAVAPPEIPERYDDDLVYFARAVERAMSEKAGFVLKDPT